MPVLRPARPADEPFLLQLTGRLARFPVPAWRTPEQIQAADHKILREALHSPTPEVSILIVEEDGQPAGFVFSTTRKDYFTGAPHAHVEVLAVADGAEGRGLAGVLMAAAEDWARGRGYSHVTLNVFAANSRARGLYERLGYRPETLHYLKPL